MEQANKRVEADAERRRKRSLAAEVEADFERRRQMRRSLERAWQLNMNFVSGNQFCDISPASGEIEEETEAFY